MNTDGAAGHAMQARISGGAPLVEEHTTFSVRIASNADDLWKAVRVRHAAYARHLPELAARLTTPEPLDYDESSVVLLAEAKLDGAPLGTLRIQTNRAHRLLIEQSLALPPWLQGLNLAEATRLGVSQGRTGRVVKTMLFKAFFHYCLSASVEWMVIGARPPLDRQYEALLFRDVMPGGSVVPLRHASNLPHRVMAFEIVSAEHRWAEAEHPLYDFFCRTFHPDIDVRETRRDLRRAAVAGEVPA